MIESASFPISAMFVFQGYLLGSLGLMALLFYLLLYLLLLLFFTTTTSISPSSTSSTFSPFSVFSCIAIGLEIVSAMNSAVLKRWLACIYSCLSHQICCQAERGQD